MATCIKWVPKDGGQQCTVVYSEFAFGGTPNEVVQFVEAAALLFVAVFLWRIFRRVL
jgi:hypothetical protein